MVAGKVVGIAKTVGEAFITKKAVASALCDSSCQAMKKASSNIDDLANSAKNLSQSARTLKDEFLSSRAKSEVATLVGQNNSLYNLKEAARKEFIDQQFSSATSLFSRVKNSNSFLPVMFPSGKGINLRKSDVNSIINNAQKGKDVSFEYTKKNGDIIKCFVSKLTQKQGEDCFVSKLSRMTKDGLKETVETRYYPKSGEIRAVGKGVEGQKVFYSVLGDSSGGVVNHSPKSFDINV